METISKRLKSTLQKEMEIDKIYKNEEIRRLIFEKTGMRYRADYMEMRGAQPTDRKEKKEKKVTTSPASLKGATEQ